jgi:hypothetical protein
MGAVIAVGGAGVHAVGLSGPAAGRVAAGSCVRVAIYGVKGSGEGNTSGGLGSTVAAAANDLKTDLGTSGVAIVPVDYPAVPVLDAIDNGLTGGVNYPTSRADGVQSLKQALDHQVQVCPTTWAVLIGYSQGADVIGTYLANDLSTAVRAHIAAVALIGDPRFNPADQNIDAGSYTASYGPAFGKFGIAPQWLNPEGARPALPAPLETETVSVCNVGDPICNYSWSNMVGCMGLDAWKSFYASILLHVPVAIPALRQSCAHLHYGDAGSAAILPGQPVAAAAIGQFLAADTQFKLTPWAPSPAPLPTTSQTASYLADVACPSASSCDAVGSYDTAGPGNPGFPLLVTGSGSSWQAVPVSMPANSLQPPFAQLFSVACGSPSNCVAVGWYYDSGHDQLGLVLHGGGSSWQAMQAPLPGNADSAHQATLESATCPSPTTCVAAGKYQVDIGTGINYEGVLLTVSGSTWTAAEAPRLPNAETRGFGVDLLSATCVSTAHCTAVGDYIDKSGHYQGLVVTGSGSTWRSIEAPMPPNANIANNEVTIWSVACPAATACTAGGDYTDKHGNQDGLLLSGSGTSWKAIQAPQSGMVSSVACLSASYCVAVGAGALLTGSNVTWQAHNVGTGLDEVACPSAAVCLAVGGRQVLSIAGPSWQIVTPPLPPGAAGADLESGGMACPTISQCVLAGVYDVTANPGDYPAGLLLSGPA